MATVTKLGPCDHGRPMDLDEFLAGDYEEGYQYELIDGNLYVSPEANLPRGRVEKWIFRKLDRYSEDFPDVINFVYNKARIFVPGHPGITIPEPDLAAYRGFPLYLPFEEVQWEDVSPILVGEILSNGDPAKDLVRNVTLYWQVRTIKEYWLFDAREDPNHPHLTVYRRYGKKWRTIRVAPSEIYMTKLLPGFQLVLDPRR